MRKLVAARLGVEECDIRLDSDFRNDFGAESLEVVELVMALEAEFRRRDRQMTMRNGSRPCARPSTTRGSRADLTLLDHRPMPWSFPAKRCAPPPARAGGKVRDVPRFDYAGSSSPPRADPGFFARHRGSEAAAIG